MKPKFNSVMTGLWRSLLCHPVELIVLLHAMVAAIANGTAMWQAPAFYAPFAVMAALCLWFYRERRWAKWCYWVVLPLYALCALLPKWWPETGMLYVLIMPAYLLVCKGDFSARLFSLVRSLVVAVGMGVLAFLLLFLIYASINLLFEIDWRYVEEIIPSFCFILLAPMVFIGMESGGGEPKASKLEEALVNWVLTIALLIYNVVLYAYLFTILVDWDLPKGSVSIMVTAFMVVLMAVRWLRPMLSRQPLEWYFRWSGLLALPLVALFWVAVGYRIGQYGLTIDRCALIASGVGMTVYAVVSLFRPRRGGYGFMALTVIVGLLLVLSARPLSMHSQTTLARHSAEVAGVLADDGTLKTDDRYKNDAVHRAEHRCIYQAMKYMERDLKDTAAVRQRFGMSSDEYIKRLSPSTASYAKAWSVDRFDDVETIVELPLEKGYLVRMEGESVMMNLNEFSHMYVNVGFSDGKITLDGKTIHADSVLAVQLAEIGYSLDSELDCNRLDTYRDQLCYYKSPDGQICLIFNKFYIDCRDDGNHMEYGTINCALIK